MEIPSQMMESLRDYLDEPTEGYWSNRELANRLFQSSNRIVRKIGGIDPTFFLRTTNLTFVADQPLYDLPRNARLGARWDHALKKNSNGEVQGFVYESQVRDRVINDFVKVPATNSAFRLSLQDQQARITPAPTTALSNAVEIAYVPVFGDLHEGSVSAATSTTLTFPATPDVYRTGSPSVYDDDYIGMLLVITAGTGVGQIREITDYTGGTTLRATVESWGTTPDTTSTYAVVSPVPDDFHDVVVLDAAVAAAAKSTKRRFSEMLASLEFRSQEMYDWVGERQTFRNLIVIPDLSAGVF
tara:strand:- start:3339 stop:4238 length:900 start_codon:yes stop_codon:yes gene_type:complete